MLRGVFNDGDFEVDMSEDEEDLNAAISGSFLVDMGFISEEDFFSNHRYVLPKEKLKKIRDEDAE